MFGFKLYGYNKDYYQIYQRLLKADLSKIPSFRQIKKWISVKPNELILDAGCGTGHQLNYYCGDATAGIGVDFTEVAIRIARENFPKHQFLVQDLAGLEFEDEKFDKIVCFNTIEHIQDQDKAMKELKRVLKKDGVIVMGTNIRDSLQWRLYQMFIKEQTHTREFSVREFVDFVSQYFIIIETKVSSGVFRVPTPFRWIFHYILKGDILIKATK